MKIRRLSVIIAFAFERFMMRSAFRRRILCTLRGHKPSYEFVEQDSLTHSQFVQNNVTSLQIGAGIASYNKDYANGMGFDFLRHHNLAPVQKTFYINPTSFSIGYSNMRLTTCAVCGDGILAHKERWSSNSWHYTTTVGADLSSLPTEPMNSVSFIVAESGDPDVVIDVGDEAIDRVIELVLCYLVANDYYDAANRLLDKYRVEQRMRDSFCTIAASHALLKIARDNNAKRLRNLIVNWPYAPSELAIISLNKADQAKYYQELCACGTSEQRRELGGLLVETELKV